MKNLKDMVSEGDLSALSELEKRCVRKGLDIEKEATLKVEVRNLILSQTENLEKIIQADLIRELSLRLREGFFYKTRDMERVKVSVEISRVRYFGGRGWQLFVVYYPEGKIARRNCCDFKGKELTDIDLVLERVLSRFKFSR